MSYKYDPINKMLIRTRDEDRSKLNSVLLKDMRKPKEYNPLDYRIRLQKLGYRPEVINKEMRSYKDGAGYADLKETKDANWTDVYKEFDKIVEKYFPNERKIEAEVKALYMKHKGDPAWDEAYRRWMDSPTNDSKTVDYSIRDAESVFNYLDKEVQRDLISYSKVIQKADTTKKCEELDRILEGLKEHYADEYLDVWNKVGQYAQNKRSQTIQLFNELKSQAFKKYQELNKAGK